VPGHRFFFPLTVLASLLLTAGPAAMLQAQQPQTMHHYVGVRSSVPALAGQVTQIYVRERVRPDAIATAAPATARRVVLFVHGAGTPAEVAFDVPRDGYSWMAHLANAGLDVFAMDQTGYGRSTRPPVMNDPCNLSAQQQSLFVPAVTGGPCTSSYPHQLTTIASDWEEIHAVVEYIRRLRGVDRVSLVAWSLGAPRAGGFTLKYPDRVESLVVLAPAFNRTGPSNPPVSLPAPGVPMTTQSQAEFLANWDRQVGCTDQYESSVRDAVWSSMIESDPVGATWGSGVRRAPSTTVWGWNSAAAKQLQVPVMLVAGVHDRQVTPDRVRALYEDAGSGQKVLVDLACASHNAMWERNRALLFDASLEWITRQSVNGTKSGVVRVGY
jgi:pimeloyl-ACP methyl ester carboxylesterase